MCRTQITILQLIHKTLGDKKHERHYNGLTLNILTDMGSYSMDHSPGNWVCFC